MQDQLNTIDDLLDKIDDLILDMDLPLHVTRPICSQLYAFYDDLEGAVVEQEKRAEQAAIEQEKRAEEEKRSRDEQDQS